MDKKMRAVYLVQHLRPEEDGEPEDVKIVGIFSSRANAEAAVRKVMSLPGFKRYPDGFHIDRYELNGIWFAEGFGFD